MEKIGGSVRIKKIAITGTPSAGKSTVCELLKAHGAYVVKADDIVHDLLSQDQVTIQEIRQLFGAKVIVNEKVDRKALANLVFTDSEQLHSLEAILHPKVVTIIQETFNRVQNTNSLFVVEIPLLFEIGIDSWFDTILFISASPEVCKERFIAKGFSEEQFVRRLQRFKKEIKPSIVIENNGSIEGLTQEIEKWIKNINKRNP